MKYVIIAMSLGCLSACATGPELPIEQTQISVDFTQKRATKNIERADLIEVRTIVNHGGSWTEIGAANCKLVGRGFEKTFQTPAIVRLPVYLGRTDNVRFQCRANIDGTPKISGKTIVAKNLSAPEDEPLTLSTGTSGTSVGAVIGLRNRNKDRFDYPSRATITFRP